MPRRPDNGPRKIRLHNLSAFAFKQQAQINILRESIYNTLRAGYGADSADEMPIQTLRVRILEGGTAMDKRFLAFADAIWKAETALFDAQDHVR